MKSTFHGKFGTRCSTSHNNVRPSIMGVNFPDLRRRFPQKVRVPPYVLRSIVDTPAKSKNSLNMRRPWLLPPYTSPKRKFINQWQPNGDASGTDMGPFFPEALRRVLLLKAAANFTCQLLMPTCRELLHLPTSHVNFLRVTSPANFSCQLFGCYLILLKAQANLSGVTSLS